MKVVGILHGKGGVGKSTVAVNLARALQLRGYEPVIIDCDAQGTAQSWKASRGDEAELPPVFGVGKASALEADVRRLSDSFDVAVIDGGAHLDKMHASIIKASDLALIPVQPSPTDIWPTEQIVELIKRRQEVTGSPSAVFVISRRKAGTKLGDTVQNVLSRFDLPVWEGTCDRVAYAEAMGKGRSVVEMSDSKAAEEIQSITDNVLNTIRHE
ncbi:ParA family partition ATPase [Salinibacter ruber]|uniref:ParA family partition ATPase n=1 Tax=Salinibacter ruber TaxID=146919 RepID=UPI002074131A|nr:ParA family partition ATPase [Salinibacter ruber]